MFARRRPGTLLFSGLSSTGRPSARKPGSRAWYAPGSAVALDPVIEVVMRIEDGGGLRVLLVEDSLDEGELLQMALVDHGFQVLHVLTAEEALSGLARLKGRDLPDLILFDLRLPGMGGAELSRALHEHPSW